MERAVRSEEEVVRHANWEPLKAVIRAVKSLAEKQRFRLSIVLVPPKEEVYSWVLRDGAPWSTPSGASGFSAALEKACAQENIPYLDLKPFLVRESHDIHERSGDVLYWHDDGHLNALGSRFAAAVIHDELLRRKALPAERPGR